MSGKDPELTADQIADLYGFLAHGDVEHRAWLLRAIIAWSEGKVKPPVKGKND